MDLGSPSSKKTEDFASLIRNNFPTLISLHSQWSNLTSIASLAANEMVNLIMKIKQLETSDDWGVLSSDETTKKNVIFKLELQMQAKARSLEASFEDLCKKYSKAKQVVEMLENRYYATLPDSSSNTPVLLTAPITTWIEWSNQLLSMFTQDLVLKRTLITELGRVPADKRNTFLLYLNAWSACPLLDYELITAITDMAKTELELSATPTTPSKQSPLNTPDRSGSKSATKSPSSSSKSSASKTSRSGKSPSVRR